MEFADIIRISRVDNVRLRRPAEPPAEVQIQDTEILVLYLIWKYRHLESFELTHTKGDRCCHWAPPDPLVGGGAGKTGSKRNLATPQERTGGAPLLTQSAEIHYSLKGNWERRR